jgi:ubiquinone/menaquinone biosynthesis C-methylase UbiE
MLPRQLLKLGFHLLYNQLAFTYDLVAWLVSFGQWAAWRRLALGFTHPGPTLELAYGTGGFFADLLEAGYRPVGIDRSPFMARLAQQKLRLKNLPAPLNRANAQHLPFPAEKFSTVIATFPTNYIFKDDTLAEIHRVLAANGRLVVVFEGQLRGPWPLRPLIDWLYAITNQRGFYTLRPLSAFERHQLSARWQMVERDGATARLLIADKR